jgi:hypothetical protein
MLAGLLWVEPAACACLWVFLLGPQRLACGGKACAAESGMVGIIPRLGVLGSLRGKTAGWSNISLGCIAAPIAIKVGPQYLAGG